MSSVVDKVEFRGSFLGRQEVDEVESRSRRQTAICSRLCKEKGRSRKRMRTSLTGLWIIEMTRGQKGRGGQWDAARNLHLHLNSVC